jgi:alkylation response protein AidB-like acyl-CoA dehydrogenase
MIDYLAVGIHGGGFLMDFSLTKQQKDIKKAAAEFARREFLPEVAQDYELNHRYPRELFKKAAQLGFMGLDYPERIGGGGMGVTENVLVIEEFCKADSGLGMALHLGYVPSKVIKVVGSPQQQEKFLGPLVRGDWISAIAMTEPDHGSDLTRMETTLVEEKDGFVINGTKVFTTNGSYADFFVVLAQEVERRYRDNRIVEIYEGTVEVQLNNRVRILKKLNLDFLTSTLL